MAVEKKLGDTVRFYYVKSPDCKEVPVTGAFGGINNATGELVMSVFSERAPIPQSIEYGLQEGKLSGEIGRESKDGMVRSVHAVLHFNIGTAVALHSWLGDKIEHFSREHDIDLDKQQNDL